MTFTPEEAVYWHRILIGRYGGLGGIRDFNALADTLQRPEASFDGVFFYPIPTAKAAAFIESMIINHPFMDGNKRIAFFLAEMYLLECGITLTASEEQLLDLALSVAAGSVRRFGIEQFLNAHTVTGEGIN
jgi:death on curing protein